jgi:murein DD-endopeptidase MepM/ murein hydrolase activator NlpD
VRNVADVIEPRRRLASRPFTLRAAVTAAVAVGVLLGALGIPAGPGLRPALAADSRKQQQAQLKAQINALRDEEDAAAAQEADLAGKLQASKTRRAQLDARVGQLDARIRTVQGGVDAAEARLEQLAGELVNAEAQLSAAKLSAAKTQLHQRAVEAYVNPAGVQVVDMILRTTSVRDLSAKVSYLESVVGAQTRAVHRFEDLRRQAQDLAARVDATRDQARQQRDVVVAQRAALDVARQAQDELRRQVIGEQGTEEALLAQVRQRKADFESQIAALQRQSDAISALLRGVQAGQTPGVSGHGVFAVPIPGAPITSGFGPRVHPIFGDVRMHTGIDFGASEGTPILAAGNGTVVSAEPLGGYGNATIIDHGGSLATLYGHQQAIVVTVGQHVQRGQLIGYVGCTGYCTGPHLHFEVRVNGNPVDPIGYL